MSSEGKKAVLLKAAQEAKLEKEAQSKKPEKHSAGGDRPSKTTEAPRSVTAGGAGSGRGEGVGPDSTGGDAPKAPRLPDEDKPQRKVWPSSEAETVELPLSHAARSLSLRPRRE